MQNIFLLVVSLPCIHCGRHVFREKGICCATKPLRRNSDADQQPEPRAFSYPDPFLRAVRRGALAKSITGNHKNMVRKQCPVLELANQMPVRNMDLARAPRHTARKKGSGYENGTRATVRAARAWAWGRVCIGVCIFSISY